MEYVLFRILRLIDKEIKLYEDLYNCLIQQNIALKNVNINNLLTDHIEQKAAVLEITQIETDVRKEIVEMSNLLKLNTKQPNITMIVEKLKNKYPKLCGKFTEMSNQVNDLLTQIDLAKKENEEFLRQNEDLCCDVLPIIDAWEDFEAILGRELENLNLNAMKGTDTHVPFKYV